MPVSKTPVLTSIGDRLRALLKLAQNGDDAARAEARELMDANPAAWRGLANLPLQAEHSLIDGVYGEQSLSGAAVHRRLREMRAELAQAGDSALEQLAISRVVTTWLACHLAEIVSAQRTSGSFAQLDFYQRRLTQAQRRHLAAIRTLATLRRLLVPRLPDVRIDQVGQLNVGQHQTNGAAIPAHVIGGAQ